MFANIKIGEKTVPMLSTAACNIYYKTVFGVDPIRLTTQASRGELADEDAANFAMQMGFIFAKAAEAPGDRSKMLTLNFDAYVDWIDQFETVDVFNAAGRIMALYNGDRPDSKEKKEEN